MVICFVVHIFLWQAIVIIGVLGFAVHVKQFFTFKSRGSGRSKVAIILRAIKLPRLCRSDIHWLCRGKFRMTCLGLSGLLESLVMCLWVVPLWIKRLSVSWLGKLWLAIGLIERVLTGVLYLRRSQLRNLWSWHI